MMRKNTARIQFDMQNANSIVSIAMLSLYNKKNNQNYLDFIAPFVGVSLPHEPGSLVSIDEIQHLVLENYGINIPKNVVERILKKLAKDNIVKKQQKNYYLVAEYPADTFHNRRERIRASIDRITAAFQSFLQEKSFANANNAPSRCESILMMFFEQYGYLINYDLQEVNDLSLRNKDRGVALAGKFIIEEEKKQSSVFDDIIQLTKGLYAYKAVYYYGELYNKTDACNLSHTSVYLDTPLLIDALNYDTDEGHSSVEELIDLIQKHKGKARTYSTYVSEVDGILRGYQASPTNYNLKLWRLQKNNYSPTDIERLRLNLSQNLDKCGIEQVDPLPFDQNDSSWETNIDEKALTSLLEGIIKDSNGNPRLGLIEKDVKAISSVSRERKIVKASNLESCKAVLITRNTALINSTTEIIIDRIQKGEFALAISDIDFTATLWLNSYSNQTSLAKKSLIASAYAACEPSVSIMNLIKTEIDRLKEESPSHSDKEVFSMREMKVFADELSDELGYDYDSISPDSIKKLYEKITLNPEHIIAERDQAIEEARKKEDSGRQLALINADEKGRKIQKRLKRVFFAVYVLVFSSFLLYAIISLVKEIGHHETSTKAICCAIIGFLIMLLGIIDCVVPKWKHIIKAATLIAEKAREKEYTRQIELLSKREMQKEDRA